MTNNLKDSNTMKNSSKKIALNGILAALAVICIFLATILPTSRLSFYALSSFLIAIIIIEYDAKTAFIFYIVTNIISFFLIPDKIKIIPYSIFFGIYGIVKYYIEKINKIVLEYVLKYIYFNVCVLVLFLLFKDLIVADLNIDIKYLLWIGFLVMEIIFILYDYIYSLFIQYYIKKLRRYLKMWINQLFSV